MSAAAVSAPPCHSARPSPLNPHSSRATPSPTSSSTGKPNNAVSATRRHLANLDRLLVKPPPLPLPLPSHPCRKLPSSVVPSPAGDGDDGGHGGGLLKNALNLSTFFLPFTRNADEMSPRSLAHMQRLLTLSPRLSPKGSIARDWRRYHGGGGDVPWAGLLDPLDPDLRRELLRYGDFVQAAYTAFHSTVPSADSQGQQQQQRTLVLPDRSYRPTRSLFASSSLTIPPWAAGHNNSWLTQRTSFVGYVAVCESEREVRRMGRRDIAVVLRGTATCPEWAENLRTGLVPLTPEDETTINDASPSSGVPKVAKGFLSLYRTAGDGGVPSLSADIVAEVKRLMEVYRGEELSITIVGHSLGASLALLAADELSSCLHQASDADTDVAHRPTPPIAVVSFGGPKTGNGAFAERLQRERGVNVLRVVNAGDVVTRVPMIAPRRREGGGGSNGSYVHAGGAELRLRSGDSPCLRPGAGPACCHDLEAYLHLLDGFAGSGRPFRPDASRSVARLLAYQRTSVKRAYVERARMLGFGFEPASPTRTATANGADMHDGGQYGYLASPT